LRSIKKISGNIVDVLNSRIYPGTLEISNSRIINIQKDRSNYSTFIIPGFIDSHVHIESSMLIPSEFARIASVHGTVAVVTDPHEIANVLGIKGVNYMIENGKAVPFKFYFGAPSCVPATSFETAGAGIDAEEVEELLKKNEIKYLSEVMNFPGVLSKDASVMEKIRIAMKLSKKIDGHAPGLRGEDARKYIEAGISTDHECITKEEALEKLRYGMKILIREGSAAKNLDEFAPFIEDHPNDCMLCTDDVHPDGLTEGHINRLVKKALKQSIEKMKVLRCACVNPVLHYGLEVGLLQNGDFADFIVIDNFNDLNVLKTFINGKLVAKDGKTLLTRVRTKVVNNFKTRKKKISDFYVRKAGENINVIEAIDGRLITNRLQLKPKITDGFVVSDPDRDTLKVVVVNRYHDAPPAIGFVKGFGLKRGAIASSVAHDSHNIISLGVLDKEICQAVNLVIEYKGGLSVIYDGVKKILPLPVAGIMSCESCHKVARQYSELDKLVKKLGSNLKAPFMTLSFMALLVIPRIKLSDKGLFDGERFEFISLFSD
jgi:adenine deaminase